ncbi:MAG: YceI family protein [Winogradskyella sp.]|nr:YceI family protein [Winogradskyella sp.]
MKGYLLYVLFFCYGSVGFSQNSSSINFVIKNLGINVDGRFNSFSVTTKFNESTLELERISGSIKVSSIKTGIDGRDEHLLEEDYFNAETYKQITLTSESITKVSETSYKVEALLTIKGITKPITIKADVVQIKDRYKISSTFEIDRKDFNVGGSSFVMSKTVKINVIHYQRV